MKKEQKLATSVGVTSIFYLEEGVLWLFDRIIDLGLVYKDAIVIFINNI